MSVVNETPGPDDRQLDSRNKKNKLQRIQKVNVANSRTEPEVEFILRVVAQLQL